MATQDVECRKDVAAMSRSLERVVRRRGHWQSVRGKWLAPRGERSARWGEGVTPRGERSTPGG